MTSHLQRGIRELPSTKALDRLLVEGKGGCCVAVRVADWQLLGVGKGAAWYQE